MNIIERIKFYLFPFRTIASLTSDLANAIRDNKKSGAISLERKLEIRELKKTIKEARGSLRAFKGQYTKQKNINSKLLKYSKEQPKKYEV